MKFCQPHWDRLKAAIIARGLGDYICNDGEEALKQAKDQIAGKPATKKNFDPLMGAHWAIVNNAMTLIKDVGGDPLAMLGAEDGTPQACPICYLNWISAEHDKVCTDPNCQKEKGLVFDSWIDCAADGIKEHLQTLPD